MIKKEIIKGRNIDQFIYAYGNSNIINFFLSSITILQMFVIICMGFVIINLTKKVNEQKVLPVFIDRISGSARPIDFDVIDASGKQREESEINDFCSDFISNLYTFNRLTVGSNLKKVLEVSNKNTVNSIRQYLQNSKRAEYINSDNQGIVNIKSIVILESNPTIVVQVFFERLILYHDGEIQEKYSKVSIIKLKTVLRSRGNAHGLYVIEYRETKYEENNNN